MFDFRSIKNMLGNYADELKKLRAQIEALEIEREDVMFAPPVLSDVRAAMVGWIESMRGSYQATLKMSLASLAAQRDVVEGPGLFAKVMLQTPLMHPSTISGRPTNGENDRALCGLFGDVLIKSIDATLNQLDWPQGGLSTVDRNRRLEELDKKLEALRADEQGLVSAAGDVGLNVEAVG